MDELTAHLLDDIMNYQTVMQVRVLRIEGKTFLEVDNILISLIYVLKKLGDLTLLRILDHDGHLAEEEGVRFRCFMPINKPNKKRRSIEKSTCSFSGYLTAPDTLPRKKSEISLFHVQNKTNKKRRRSIEKSTCSFFGYVTMPDTLPRKE
jgi:hypothetical protein